MRSPPPGNHEIRSGTIPLPSLQRSPVHRPSVLHVQRHERFPCKPLPFRDYKRITSASVSGLVVRCPLSDVPFPFQVAVLMCLPRRQPVHVSCIPCAGVIGPGGWQAMSPIVSSNEKNPSGVLYHGSPHIPRYRASPRTLVRDHWYWSWSGPRLEGCHECSCCLAPKVRAPRMRRRRRWPSLARQSPLHHRRLQAQGRCAPECPTSSPASYRSRTGTR